jgi:hypothetical protein
MAAPIMDIHHKDGDTKNNDLGNLMGLCRSCHMHQDGRIHNLKKGGGRIAPDRDGIVRFQSKDMGGYTR